MLPKLRINFVIEQELAKSISTRIARRQADFATRRSRDGETAYRRKPCARHHRRINQARLAF